MQLQCRISESTAAAGQQQSYAEPYVRLGQCEAIRRRSSPLPQLSSCINQRWHHDQRRGREHRSVHPPQVVSFFVRLLDDLPHTESSRRAAQCNVSQVKLL